MLSTTHQNRQNVIDINYILYNVSNVINYQYGITNEYNITSSIDSTGEGDSDIILSKLILIQVITIIYLKLC